MARSSAMVSRPPSCISSGVGIVMPASWGTGRPGR
jgi:hypothetical protein